MLDHLETCHNLVARKFGPAVASFVTALSPTIWRERLYSGNFSSVLCRECDNTYMDSGPEC